MRRLFQKNTNEPSEQNITYSDEEKDMSSEEESKCNLVFIYIYIGL